MNNININIEKMPNDENIIFFKKFILKSTASYGHNSAQQ